LQDGPAIQSYINGRLVLFVQIEEERQLLRGAAGSELSGLLLAAIGVPIYNGGTAAGNKAEQLFKAMNSMRGSALVEPEWCIMSPSDYETVRLLKDTNGQLYGGGPFYGPYGNGGQASPSNQIAGGGETVWNKTLLVTSAAGAGTALIGTRANAQVWRRGGMAVEASNSHASYFSANLVAIRAEERLALTVYRAGGYCCALLA
jgi:HK97 family phage major capsid protein